MRRARLKRRIRRHVVRRVREAPRRDVEPREDVRAFARVRRRAAFGLRSVRRTRRPRRRAPAGTSSTTTPASPTARTAPRAAAPRSEWRRATTSRAGHRALARRRPSASPATSASRASSPPASPARTVPTRPSRATASRPPGQHKAAKVSPLEGSPYLSRLRFPTLVSQAHTFGTEVIISPQGLVR